MIQPEVTLHNFPRNTRSFDDHRNQKKNPEVFKNPALEETCPGKKLEDFDLFADENEIGALETELLKNWDRHHRKALPLNTLLLQKVSKIKPTALPPGEII
jgi:hypothetical protein